MKNIIILISLLIFLVSCKKSEKTLVSLSLKVKTEKTVFLKKFESNGLNLEALVNLKKYSDDFAALVSSVAEVTKSKRGRKGLAKYIKKSKTLDSLCSSYMLENVIQSQVLLSCNEGHFNICPMSFSKITENRIKLVKAIEKSVGRDFLTKTDCKLD
jgi:hypothetical protein